MEPRGLSEDMFVSIEKENRLNDSFTTEDLGAESPTSRLGRGVKLPEKLSGLRQKLSLKAKQERRSQRPFRPPEGRTMHGHLRRLGLVSL